MEPGRLELYPYHTFIESSEETDAAPALVLSGNKMFPDKTHDFMWHQRRGQRSAESPQSDIVGVTLWKLDAVSYLSKTLSRFHQVGCLTHQLLLPSPPSSFPQVDLSLHAQRGWGKWGGFSCCRGRQALCAIHLHKRQDQRSTQE